MNELITASGLSYSAEVRDLSGKKFQKNILRNISLKIYKNEIVGIAGESGSGKTTLGKILSGIINEYEGTVTRKFDERERTSPVQILFQNSGEILNPFRKVDSIINEALRIKWKEKIDEKKEELLSLLDIRRELLGRKGSQLSGGEQQRIALARIIAVDPKLIIADEPFSSQDAGSQKNIMKTFLKINKEKNIAFLCITHNLKLLRELARRILVMYDGRIVEEGPAEEVLQNPKEGYTKFLLSAESYDLSYADFINFRKETAQ